MNWLKRHASKWRRSSPLRSSDILSHHSVPKMGIISSGMPTGLVRSTSWLQSRRSLPIHWRRVPLS